MSYYVYTNNPTPTSGYWADTTESVFPSVLRQILVKSATSTTVFDVRITDVKDRIVQEVLGIVGEINDLTQVPADGVYTVEILNATADEEFNVKLSFDEGH